MTGGVDDIGGDGDAIDPILPTDTLVGDYRIRGLVDEGAMGRIYLAQDMRLGRRVALKFVKQFTSSPTNLARFFEEARATASFSHPHVVALHGVGEFLGRPYLALEYLDGESLRQRMARDPIPLAEGLRVLRCIADATADAHLRGLVHADLKPENIVIARDGRPRVVDFGLAKVIGTAAIAASGTPAYMAPERWSGDAITAAIDVWALGILMFEVLGGERPFSDHALAALVYAKQPPVLPQAHAHARWYALARACLARDPEARPAAEDVVRQLTGMLDPSARVSSARSPYPGLSAFTADDSSNYFGRERELDAVVEQLRSSALIPIIGPSGIGKSSFVHASVVPRLTATGQWSSIALRPGTTPFVVLASALDLSGEHARMLVEQPQTLALRLGERVRERTGRLLLFVDQFEEVFTLAPDHARAFCDCLAASASVDDRWRIVITIRDDFVGRLAESPAMRAHFGALVALTAMSASELREAVLRPLASVGFAMDEPELVSRMVSDVEAQPACLPLLQFVCRALWDRRDEARRVLRAREYDEMGGASGALAVHAQRTLAQLSPEQVRVARIILLGLINPDGTRRPRSRSALCEGVDGAELVIERLLEHRLVVASRDLDGAAARIELAHEALATTWPQLVRWLDESSEQRMLVADLEQAAELWERRGRRDDETWSGAALGEAVRKLTQWQVTVPSRSRWFLDAALAREKRSARRRRTSVVLGTTLLAAVAVGAIVAAVAFKNKERGAIAANEQIRLAAADMGRFSLRLAPFDWDVDGQHAVTPSSRVGLRWRMFVYDPRNPFERGKELANGDLVRGPESWAGMESISEVEARAVPAMLEIQRGACSPSIVVLRKLPGFDERATAPTIRLQVPTCDASRADTIQIPAGEFFANVDREDGGDGSVDRRELVAAFSIDRTEVSRAAFDVYATMETHTGDSAAFGTFVATQRGDDPVRAPAVGINFQTARNYCRFLGKDLPSVEQWQKAYRGGLVIGAAPNPEPLRLTPWLVATSPHPANLADAGGTVAQVGRFPDDTSPYGVVDLAGNVREWTRDLAPRGRFRGLRIVLGGSFDASPDDGDQKVNWRNTRFDRYLDFTLGMRCVTDPAASSGSP